MKSKNVNQEELVVIFKSEAAVRTTSRGTITSRKLARQKVLKMRDMIKKDSAALTPVFGQKRRLNTIPRQARTMLKNAKMDPKSMYSITGPKNLKKLRDSLLKEDFVEGAYLKPAAEDPGLADQVTPDFTGNQGYLNAAPQGVDARFAWNFGGGRGDGIDVIDMEQGFNLTHTDLQENFGGLIQGNNTPTSHNHGTAVLGVIGADENDFGVTGISPNSKLWAISYRGLGTAQTIIDAADRLNAGDILLLEVHRKGPAGSGVRQDGYIAIEWWPDDFAAIVYATSKGVIVVEAAGNGAEDLDAKIYDKPKDGFPGSWKNPFNKNNPQSGAIVVGAGSPWSSSDRTILGFSNYGSRVDAQGWGQGVATTGYGGLQGDMFTTIDPFNSWQAEAGFPKSLGSDIGMPNSLGSGIDAALWSGKNNKVYFFKEDRYTRMDAVTHAIDPDYPKDIEGNWKGFPSDFEKGVDAALWNEKSQKVYFFKGSKYIRLNPNNGWKLDAGYPKNISGNWPGMPASFTSGIDAAMWNDKNNRVYMFKGNQYVRLNPLNSWKVDAGYPKPIAGNWGGLTGSYRFGITATYYSPVDKKLYMTKKEDNYWYTSGFSGTSSASPVVLGAIACIQGRLKARGKSLLTPTTAQNILRSTGSPQLRFDGAVEQNTASNWPGVNATFGRGIDAALWNGKSDKIYFFRGSQYLRIDPKNGWNVDIQYPKPIKGNWPGFPEDFESGVDAAFWSDKNKRVYFFKGSEYIRVNPNNSWEVDAGYPKSIAANWNGLPASFTSDLDAVIWNGKNNRVYFFKDNEYVRINPLNSWNADPGYPKPIQGNWPNLDNGFTSNIDAAVWSGTNKKVYFFKDEDYVRIDPFDGWKMGNGYPKVIARQRIGNRPDIKEAFQQLDIDSNWPGFPSSFGQDIDAAFWADKNNRVYFFKGNQYLRVNPNNNWEVDPGYPKNIAGNWSGFPASFTNGIDAIVGNDKNNRVYVFKGNEYIRINPLNGWNVDPGYPKPIAGNWSGFPADFAAGVDAAVFTKVNKKIYFFKGNEYIKVDPHNGFKVAAGYPKPINNNWPGVSSPFTSGIDCALWNDKSDKLYFFKDDEYLRINPSNGWKVDKYYPRPIIN